MSKKVSITLDDEVLKFVDQLTSNRSSFINDVLSKEQQRVLISELAAAYTAQANDVEFRSEIADWDVTVGDGLNA